MDIWDSLCHLPTKPDKYLLFLTQKAEPFDEKKNKHFEDYALLMNIGNRPYSNHRYWLQGSIMMKKVDWLTRHF